MVNTNVTILVYIFYTWKKNSICNINYNTGRLFKIIYNIKKNHSILHEYYNLQYINGDNF